VEEMKLRRVTGGMIDDSFIDLLCGWSDGQLDRPIQALSDSLGCAGTLGAKRTFGQESFRACRVG
jgi:hypothetical protein